MSIGVARTKVLTDGRELRNRWGQKLVLAHGCFDILHPGHISYLREAKKMGDLLVVSVTSDAHVGKGPGKPVFHLWERMEQLAALEVVDYVVASEGPTAVQVIQRLHPDIFVKGGDYDQAMVVQEEKEAVARVGGMIRFTPYFPVPKSDLNGVFNVYPEATWDWLRDFRHRHSWAEISATLDALATLTVVVVGERITDRYTFVSSLTKSPREHHLSVRYLRQEDYEGGTRAIQRHLEGFVQRVVLVSQNEPIIKERFVEEGETRKLFSVQRLPSQLTLADEGNLRYIGLCDLVLAMDYGHGLFSSVLRERIEREAKFLAVNCQTNSANYGMNLITKWHRLDFTCMDRPEYNLAVTNNWNPAAAGQLIVTDGPRGCLVGRTALPVPTFVTHLVDRVGAGDVLFSLSAALVAQGADVEVAGFLGSCAAAMQCETVGNEKPIDPKILRKFIQRLLC